MGLRKTKTELLAGALACAFLLAACGSSTDTVAQSSATESTGSAVEQKLDSEVSISQVAEEDYSAAEDALMELYGLYYLDDPAYEEVYLHFHESSGMSECVSCFDLYDYENETYTSIDNIQLIPQPGYISGAFESDSNGNIGTIRIDFDEDETGYPIQFYFSLHMESGDYDLEDGSNIHNFERIPMTYEPNKKAVFLNHLRAESLSQELNLEQLIRDPFSYDNGQIYRISGIIDSTNRDENISYGCLWIPCTDIIITFEYPGFLTCLQGDFVVFYGTFCQGVSEYYQNGILKQTARLWVDEYIIRSQVSRVSFDEVAPFEKQFAYGSYYLEDPQIFLEDTVVFTKDSFCGREYTVEYVTRDVCGNAYTTHEYADEAISFYVQTKNCYGTDTNYRLQFHYNGNLSIWEKDRYEDFYHSPYTFERIE